MPIATTVILPQLLLILLGKFLKRFKPFSDQFWKGLEAMVFYVLFPPLLFISVAKSNFNLETSAVFLFVSVGTMLIAVFFSWLINFCYKETSWTKWSVFHCGFRFNTYIGYAICQTLLGTNGMALLSFLIAIWVPISNTIAVVGLCYAGGQNQQIKMNSLTMLVSVLSNPLIIATLSGLFVNVCHIPIPEFLERTFNFLGNSSLALGLICIGASFALHDLSKYKALLISCTFERLVLVPSIAFLAAYVFFESSIESGVLIIFAALPTAQSCYVMTSRMNGNSVAVSDLTSFQTMISMLTLPIWIAVIDYFFLN